MKRVVHARVMASLPEALQPIVTRLVRQGDRLHLGLHLVGGPVRDYLLGRPIRDVDLIVEPEREAGSRELAQAAASRDARVVVHDRFGTVRIETGAGVVDLATVRSEHYEKPGALPTVAAGTLEQDLSRRDFTVNALAIPLSDRARRGRAALIDPGTGAEDLRAGVLRVFHAKSFHDDPTRALRAARLAPRLGFRLSRSARTALRGALRDGAFGAVKGERFRAEFEKLFEDPEQGLDPSRALRLLDDWHILGALEPGLHLHRNAVAPLRRLGRAIAELPWPRVALRPWVAGLMVWLAPVDAALRRRALGRLAVRGQHAQQIRGFPKQAEAWLARLARERGRGACDAVLGGASEEALLAVFASAPAPARRRIERYAAHDRNAVLPIAGDDLLALGLRGPAVGRALARVRAAWLDRDVRTREEALALAREFV